MAEATTQVGRITFHFYGSTPTAAQQIKERFDNLYDSAPSFKDRMDQTSNVVTTTRDVYFANSLQDLQSAPGYANAGFDDARWANIIRDAPGFMKSGPDGSAYVVYKSEPGSIFHAGDIFEATPELGMAHELGHVLQNYRDLQQYGFLSQQNEINVQMWEQNVAQEINKPFPNIQDTGVGYTTKLNSSIEDPYINPMCFVAGTPIRLAGGTELPVEKIRVGIGSSLLTQLMVAVALPYHVELQSYSPP